MLPVERAARDIETMRVRGAGRLARHAVRALRDLAQAHEGDDRSLAQALRQAGDRLVATRPTAVSLRNGVEEALAPLQRPGPELRAEVVAAAEGFLRRSEAAVDLIGSWGPKLLDRDGLVMTHCNSACVVGFIARAAEAHDIRAYANETRPRHQGHLTAAQLRARRVPVTLSVDSAANLLMDRIDWVVVGADTIARNGDVINKVGTSLVALAAKEHGVPLYVAAETYKVHPTARTGEDVHIEERDPREVLGGKRLPGVKVLNPVFDVTPAAYVRRIVTEAGVVKPAEVRRIAPPAGPAEPERQGPKPPKGRKGR